MKPINQQIRRIYYKRSAPIICKTPADAVFPVKSGDMIYVHSVSSVPATLLGELSKRSNELKRVSFCHIHLEKPNPCADLSETFFSNHFFIGANGRKNVANGSGSYVPVFLSEIPKFFEQKIITPDVALLNVSPPDIHGYCSLGVEVATSLPAAKAAKCIIAQINPNIPRTLGDGYLHIDQLDYIVDVNEPLPEFRGAAADDVESRIGKYISELVPNGATLQMGIGNIPNAVLSCLNNHKDLGVHTEMFSDGLIDLLNSGAVNNSQKVFQPNKTLTSFVVGSQRVYDFVDDNRAVFFTDASITNDPHIIAKNPKVVAINSAIEIDLSGQVCADSIGTRMISGIGGQVDFERGADLSPGGIPIICLPSTTKNGASKIVSTLNVGAGVVTSRYHVHWVVTEYGKVDLFGKNLIQRAKALISIAHPDHQEQLQKDALKHLSLKAWEWDTYKI